MTYVIYNVTTTAAVRDKYHISIKYFETLGAAKGGRTRIYKKAMTVRHWNEFSQDMETKLRFPPGSLEIADNLDYHKNIEKNVTRRNLMSGREYQESINTPLCCSPASETYWSM